MAQLVQNLDDYPRFRKAGLNDLATLFRETMVMRDGTTAEIDRLLAGAGGGKGQG